MFTDDVFIQSVNKSKWHIFGTCVSDLLFYTCSYLKSENKIGNLSLQNIYEDIIDREKTNGMPSDICDSLKKILKKSYLYLMKIISTVSPLKIVDMPYIIGLL